MKQTLKQTGVLEQTTSCCRTLHLPEAKMPVVSVVAVLLTPAVPPGTAQKDHA